ncbi:LysE family translocator [Sinomicrobium soli]|uniref:LysE family translocator n=1 Tax=Sinomicrobium sp. N-1-3-6 TaxID=2219864 RepID=UPI000DCB60F1|nr:LysE family translocator [Sinomicrobium sp. N-1-3-6]RAV27776.1 LysE family translocator [Sinomicrobium sp. N-1-3-6]
MNIDTFIAWLGVMLPLMISPGPANIVLAGAGMKQGVKNSIPLIIGINTVIVSYSLIIGLGLGEFLRSYPKLLFGIKMAGIVYIFYLSYKFLVIKNFNSAKANTKVYTFYDGLILQLLNPKGILMLFLMFSLFLNPNKNQAIQVLSMVLMLLILAIFCHIIWVTGGNAITKFIKHEKSQKIVNYIFSISLSIVAIWLLIDAIKNL